MHNYLGKSLGSTALRIECENPHGNETGVLNEMREKEMHLIYISWTESMSYLFSILRYWHFCVFYCITRKERDEV